MSTHQFQKLTGFSFVIGGLLVNVPYLMLINRFDYPDILRASTDTILTKFQAGGSALIYTWLALAWVGLPLLFGVVMLNRVFEKDRPYFLEIATIIGVIGLIVQVIGLLRWVFVVPVIARLYVDPATDMASKSALVALFTGIHQYGGVLLGEHMGQLLIIIWMGMISAIIYRLPMFPKWVSWLGGFASMIYLLAQTELFGTVMPGIPVIGWAGLLGSLLWLLWMTVLGIYLMFSRVESK